MKDGNNNDLVDPRDETKVQRIKRLKAELKLRNKWQRLSDNLRGHCLDAHEARQHYEKRKKERGDVMDHTFYTKQIERHDAAALKTLHELDEMRAEYPEFFANTPA